MSAGEMSDSDREPVLFAVPSPVPAVPAPVPSFREAVPTGSRTGSPFAPTGSLLPSYGGNRGPVPEPEATTTITGTHRRASIRVHSCHAPILAGLDANVAALSVAVDPYPLTPTGEVEALRDDRRTYVLLRGELDRRDAWTIPGHPPGPGCTVLAEHRCEARVPDDWKAPPAPAAAPPTTEEF